jgi:hypothetical protein
MDLQLMPRDEFHELESQLGDDTLQSNLDETFEAYRRRRLRLEDALFDTSSQRMELLHRLENLEQHFERLQMSVELLLEKPDPAKSDVSTKKPRARRKKLHSTANLDFEAFKGQMLMLHLLSEDLREGDKKQDEAIVSFDNATQAISTALRKRKLITDNDAEVDVFLARTPSVRSTGDADVFPPIPGELEAYYAAVGDLRNMRERIGDLQLEKQEQEVRRGLEEDQGQLLELNDDDFHRTWSETLRVAYNDFETARTILLEAREACDRNNIDIPSWAIVNSVGDQADLKHDIAPDQGMVSPPNSIPADSRIDKMDCSEPLLHDHGSPLATPPTNNLMSTERVARWVAGIDTPPLSMQFETSVKLLGGVTDKDVTQGSRAPFQWNDENVQSVKSAGARMIANTAMDSTTARPPAQSLGAEQSLELDEELWDIAPSNLAQ